MIAGNNEFSHGCPMCRREWQCRICYDKEYVVAMGIHGHTNPEDHPCPNCAPYPIGNPWRYLEDEFTHWVRQTRRDASKNAESE